MDDEKKIVAIYTRVSTIDQAKEGHSLEEQEKRIIKMCEANNYEIYKVYTDAGISGKSVENRKAYQQMMSDMKVKKFNQYLKDKDHRHIVFIKPKEHNTKYCSNTHGSHVGLFLTNPVAYRSSQNNTRNVGNLTY